MLHFQTRTSSDNVTWEEWKPNVSETVMENLDSNEDLARTYDWSVSNIGINQVWQKKDNTVPSASDTTSTNGRIPLGTAGKGDSVLINHATVLKDGSTYKMWYIGGNGSIQLTYYATSPDGLTWTKYDNTVATACDTVCEGNGKIGFGSSGRGDVTRTLPKGIIKDGSTYKMWYAGNDGTNYRVYYATSPDGLTWTKYDNTVPSASDTTSTNGRIPLSTTGKDN